MSHADPSRAARGPLETGSTVAIVLGALLAVGAIIEAAELNSLRSPEVWGNLRAGTWILQNHNIPRTALFSQSVDRLWRDLSWGFDAIIAALYQIVGLQALPGVVMGFRVASALVLFLLAAGRRANAWGRAGLLTLVGLYALSGVGPEPAAASVVLFGVELELLQEWRQDSQFRLKFALPLLFCVWANLDIGFVYGIAVLAIFVISLYLQPIFGVLAAGTQTSRKARTALLVLLSCVIASGLTPYGYASYAAFGGMETSAVNRNIPGYAAMGFRQPLDYVVLLLGMSAFLAMGLRRSRDVFLMALLSGSAMLAFHSQRESWLVTVSAVAVVGCMITEGQENRDVPLAGLRVRLIAVTGSSLALAVLAFFLLIPRDEKVLMAKVGEALPVRACDFIRSAGLPQPLFNAYRWGAFVSWYLPEYPVAIDSRRGLYSEEVEDGYFRVMKADVPYQSLAPMRDAKTILLEKSNVMAEALKNVGGFRVAYEDDVATVLSEGAEP